MTETPSHAILTRHRGDAMRALERSDVLIDQGNVLVPGVSSVLGQAVPCSVSVRCLHRPADHNDAAREERQR